MAWALRSWISIKENAAVGTKAMNYATQVWSGHEIPCISWRQTKTHELGRYSEKNT